MHAMGKRTQNNTKMSLTFPLVFSVIISNVKNYSNVIITSRRDDHTKPSKSEKDKYCMISLTCGIYKNDTNELIYKTEIDPQK